MPCTPDYCDIHDYPVAPAFCNMAWNNARVQRSNLYAPTLEDIDERIKKHADALYFDLRDKERPAETPELKKPESSSGFRGLDI